MVNKMTHEECIQHFHYFYNDHYPDMQYFIDELSSKWYFKDIKIISSLNEPKWSGIYPHIRLENIGITFGNHATGMNRKKVVIEAYWINTLNADKDLSNQLDYQVISTCPYTILAFVDKHIHR